ncbi:NAD(P)-dependent glycerol-3-phosphate dehydrogenase [Sphingomonas paeninsulae]|jgi:glycerol-3-phosphate dehydrogenase (NAD(P)+)|uniref:Glycerol-3-phosphate dehydrogenase [NAD(P)+] n=1 Tax=Sphingomonas paeninsulae TaxID=2319844 RepID=A0A494TAW0_SPHPE|nr:NAD(P)H-dependent glycerol-3-phosphate dehydrogenase [Sphingomonas paeninsulae]AYJ86589.1 NAD(P)-dependent glycerol-3-phosphate dehydrogenase [Sphingomonas paeninsulae]
MRIGVIGGGAWGTALAQVAAAAGDPVTLWAREHDVVASINREHENRQFLPNIPLSAAIRATESLADLVACDALLVVVPAQHLRAVLSETPVDTRPLVLCAKGIEAGTVALMSEIAHSVHPRAPIAVLSGPTFAAEVARGLPTAVTLACADENIGRALAERLAQPTFRPYASDDVAGAEIGGAVKNVLAIACGVVAGAGLGENARAALIARGFAEMVRYGVARGGRAETLSGLSGLGDLVLTCSSVASRNFSLGVGLGKGESAESLLADRASVAEGAFTAPVLAQSAKALEIAMPVVEAVCALLSGESKVDAVVAALMSRPLGREG